MKMEEEPQTEGLAMALYEAINAFEEFLSYIPVIDYYTFMGWFILLFSHISNSLKSVLKAH